MNNIEYKRKLIEKLKAHRIKKRLTYSALAERMDLPITTITSWFYGHNYPSEIAVSIIEEYLEGNGLM